jgi:ABC-2 type transport system ATP-binding protein
MSAPAPAMIEVSGLEKRFGSLTAVGGLSFAVRPGEIFGLVGPDGAGKTTTLRMLAGVMVPDAGRVVIDGIDVLADPERAKRHVSYMPQRFGLYDDLRG